MTFSEKIRLLRKEAGLTQKEVADEIGVTYRTYQNYEAGASAPSGAVLTKLSAVLGVRLDMLSDGDPENKPKKPAAPSGNRQLDKLLSEMQALFAGGSVRDEDKKYVIDALTEAFWQAKELNRKYGKKKGRTDGKLR